MGLLDGGLAQIFHGAFAGLFLDATLHRPQASTDDGAGGGEGNGFADPESVKASLDAATEAMRSTEGYVDTDVRILLLAHGVTRPTSDCEITIRNVRYGIRTVATDPAQAAWELHGRLAGNAEEVS